MSNQFGFGDILQKAFYFGVGLADYAQEQAAERFKELRTQGQKLADELVKRGEMNSEEARQFVEQLISEAQRGQAQSSTDSSQQGEPRRIEIIEEEEGTNQQEKQPSANSEDEDLDTLRQQVEALREELKRLHKK
ncbi:hypothetical protein PCC7418_3804 [Halothece sp. PCC 7418]|uniref:phasin family protein n=1 Tax=Halothece sp. (strain PCC 7418) TaxID=65093 RepID=UPI0002A08078|nr:hypothetical protein [Halothece sp. PCC 7418]AFZ45908.1 hypothetical protein PCC7418_3804 [Halothece sp. PCC 7418]